MLPDHMIEELLKRERSRPAPVVQPQVEVPMAPPPSGEVSGDDDDSRGVTIIQLWD